MASVVDIPWYANGFRGDRLESALADVTPTALRYGATAWAVHRSRDDRYKFLQIVHFEEKLDFTRWWEGPEMVEFRAITSGWYQVPVFYAWNDLVGEGRINPNPPDNGGEASVPPPEPQPEPSEEPVVHV
ncbi:MAG: hypothetical protein F2813_02670 [Actinobacteria bacterium]|uniref:Unannotated protein n=1 Tax=freshwater metagenome TaxID=449393 RepID=A0A6J5ZHF3_9ZZZZ|nr:hypothetical protein [Actinomycetota bacterium]